MCINIDNYDTGRILLMKDTNLHTFVVCAYKESSFLEDCVHSLLKQSYKSNIIMATSTDNMYIREIAEKYDIQLFVSPNQSNIATDWNFAYSLAKTKYVTLAHQDDIYDVNYSKELVEWLEKYQNALIYFSNYYEIKNNKKIYQNRNLKIKKFLLKPLKIFKYNQFVRRRVLSFGNPICCPAVTYVRDNLPYSLFKKGLKSNIDWEAWERISRIKGAFLYNEKPLMGHRVHENSTTTEIIGSNQRTLEDLELLEKFWPTPIAKIINKFYKRAEDSNAV